MRIDFAFTSLPEYFAIFNSELLMPQAGISYMFGPSRARLADVGSALGESYLPRLDLVCGFSPVNWVLIGLSSFAPTIRTEVKLVLNRSIQILLENRNILIPGEEFNTLHLSLVATLGKDAIKTEEDRMS